MLKKLLILLSITIITACGGGGDDAAAENVATDGTSPVIPVEEEYTEQYIIDKLGLPEEPDEEENNSTPTGVDKNENYIRDNVERQIAFDHYPDLQKIKLLNDYAAEYTKQIIHFSDDDKDSYIESDKRESVVIGCMSYLYGEEGYFNILTLINLLDEGGNRREESLNRTGFIGSSTLMSYSDRKKICPNYK